VFNVTNTQRLTGIANNGVARTFYEHPGQGTLIKSLLTGNELPSV